MSQETEKAVWDPTSQAVRENQIAAYDATRAGDRSAMARIATQFDGYIKQQLAVRRDAIDEILRIHAPLIANRRVTTCPVSIGEQQLEAGERLTLMWAAANRDKAVFGDSDAYDPVRNKANNLLYGAGLHVCPGERLARLELRLIMEAILGSTQEITLSSHNSPERAVFPGSGFSSLSVHFRQAHGVDQSAPPSNKSSKPVVEH